MNKSELKKFLERKVAEYNNLSFIPLDPVSVPHLFTRKQDIEIAGFFAATFAWGNRATIIRKCKELMALMDNSPHDFIVNHTEKDRKRFLGFCHRTFNDTDLLYFVSFLQHHYRKHNSLEDAFFPKVVNAVEDALNHFNTYFFSLDDVPQRTRKHVASPMKNSGCKRLNMYLRWMVRNDGKGVDFGIWKKIKPSQLVIPLDLHVARVAKRFKLLTRPNADWESALELTNNLREFDAQDPVKYDFALFALGVMEKF
ncbi:MAG: TIGR02757 family protein [Chitinophagaceae bacterium]|nr:TIGR02757 family protein [Chitinophagaceae bacterium]